MLWVISSQPARNEQKAGEAANSSTTIAMQTTRATREKARNNIKRTMRQAQQSGLLLGASVGHILRQTWYGGYCAGQGGDNQQGGEDFANQGVSFSRNPACCKHMRRF